MTNRLQATTFPIRRMLLLAAVILLPGAARAQAPDAIRDELLMHFENSMEKFIALANAMPAENYTWSPAEGVMEVGHVLMHVAHYNYMYPSENMGVTAPAGIALDAMEDVRDKGAVVRALQQSREYVLSAVRAKGAPELASGTRLYGRDVPQWAVLVQLVSHMNEHLGQSIAYARMNGVVPPWSR